MIADLPGLDCEWPALAALAQLAPSRLRASWNGPEQERHMVAGPEQLEALYDAGWSISCRVDDRIAAVRSWAQSLVTSLGQHPGAVTASAWWIPAGTGVAPRVDDAETIVLQLRGAQTWRYSTSGNETSAMLDTGCSLFVPRGVRRASVAKTDSYAISLTIQSETWFTILQRWLGWALEADYREPAHGGEAAAKAALTTLVERHRFPLDVEALWQELSSRRRS